MLLKWLFTLLAIIWLYQAIRPFFAGNQVPPRQMPPVDNKKNKRRDSAEDEGDYIDYEEIK